MKKDLLFSDLGGQCAVPLANHTTFRIGGNARYFVIAADEKNLKAIIKRAVENHIAYFVIGAGSNLLVSDQGFAGIVIKLGNGFSQIKVVNNKIIGGAGVKLVDLVKTAFEHSLAGAEFLYGIPGTLGGAVKNNAGAFDHSISEIVELVQGFHIQNSKFEITDWQLKKDEVRFDYRTSQLPRDFIITQVVLKLVKDNNQAKIRAELERISQYRKQTQPWGASAGCIFKNPKGTSAGKLLDEVGLKGYTVGDAYVSKKHANFIINRGRARFNDVLELIQIMKLRVETKTGIILEEEIEIIPDSVEGGESNAEK